MPWYLTLIYPWWTISSPRTEIGSVLCILCNRGLTQGHTYVWTSPLWNFTNDWTFRCRIVSKKTILRGQLSRISQTEIEIWLPAMFSSGHSQGSGYRDWWIMALTSLSLFLLISRAGSSSTFQPLQMPVQLQNFPVLSRCPLHTGAEVAMGFL